MFRIVLGKKKKTSYAVVYVFFHDGHAVCSDIDVSMAPHAELICIQRKATTSGKFMKYVTNFFY